MAAAAAGAGVGFFSKIDAYTSRPEKPVEFPGTACAGGADFVLLPGAGGANLDAGFIALFLCGGFGVGSSFSAAFLCGDVGVGASSRCSFAGVPRWGRPIAPGTGYGRGAFLSAASSRGSAAAVTAVVSILAGVSTPDGTAADLLDPHQNPTQTKPTSGVGFKRESLYPLLIGARGTADSCLQHAREGDLIPPAVQRHQVSAQDTAKSRGRMTPCACVLHIRNV
jgi:hypothetical protein